MVSHRAHLIYAIHRIRNMASNAIRLLETVPWEVRNESIVAISIAIDVDDDGFDEFFPELVEKFKAQRMCSPPETLGLLVTLIGNVSAAKFAERWVAATMEDQILAFFMSGMQLADVIVGTKAGGIVETDSLIDRLEPFLARIRIRHGLSQPESSIEDLLGVANEPSVAVGLIAIAEVMLPYWESRYPHDDRMERLVDVMRTWRANPSRRLRGEVFETLRTAAVEREIVTHDLSPAWDVHDVEPVHSDCPADFAGDAIVAAANAVVETKAPDFDKCAKRCLDAATNAVARSLERRRPDDEPADFVGEAIEQLRRAVLARVS
jgi:hypothetical protein